MCCACVFQEWNVLFWSFKWILTLMWFIWLFSFLPWNLLDTFLSAHLRHKEPELVYCFYSCLDKIVYCCWSKKILFCGLPVEYLTEQEAEAEGIMENVLARLRELKKTMVIVFFGAGAHHFEESMHWFVF